MIIDISRPLGATTQVWPGDPPVVIEPVARLEAGDPAAVSRLMLGTHTGTHVDPPAHFIPGGATVDELPLEVLVGPAVVVEIPAPPGPLDGQLLATLGIPAGAVRILLKTGGREGASGPASGGAGPDAATAGPAAMFGPLSLDGATWLAGRGVALVGVDTLSIEPASTDYPVHRTLLGAGVVIVEGLDLSAAPPGEYQLVCLPLRITAGDGAPARAVLMRP